MRLPHASAVLAVLLVGSLTSIAPVAASPLQDSAPSADTLAHETLAPNDGWGSLLSGTRGGPAAPADHVYTVTNRQELVAAFSIGSTPKIVFVSGTIDGNVDA